MPTANGSVLFLNFPIFGVPIRIGIPKEGDIFPSTTTNPIYYRLTAVDTGIGTRRYWNSTSIDFAQAPSAIGSWTSSTLTVLYSWK